MSAGSHARPGGSPEPEGDRPRRPRRAWSLWRLGTPVVVLLCGGLFVVSAANSDGTDLRPGRYADLAALVQDEADHYAGLRQRVFDLNGQVAALSTAMSDREVNRFQRRTERLKDPAGLEPRSGPGLTITLSDAPEEVIESAIAAGDSDVNLLVVHQQDIQAVVNALWKGGAEAVTVEGQRVVTTTGIKCEGNAVQLQGVPYPEPYVIQAVGSQADLLDAIQDDDYLQAYREQAADPGISVGWELDLENWVIAPAYDGLLDLNFATPLSSATNSG